MSYFSISEQMLPLVLQLEDAKADASGNAVLTPCRGCIFYFGGEHRVQANGQEPCHPLLTRRAKAVLDSMEGRFMGIDGKCYPQIVNLVKSSSHGSTSSP